jgi:glycosyltransferase involved in cell wall biosynthesis
MDLALSTKTFEYVNMGLPVVASRLPSLTALFNDASIHYFAPGNAAELANAIAALCHNPTARQAYVERAARVYEKFSWPIMADRYLNLINGLTISNVKWA